MFESEPYFIAEISANHLGRLSVAKDLVSAAADAGADAVKLQTYTAESMTLNIDSPEFRVSDGHELWGGRGLYELYQEAHTPLSWHEEIFSLASALGIDAFSTPFDEKAVDFLETLDVPAYKVASLEIIDLPLIQRIAQTGKPILISTGGGSLTEIAAALEAAKGAGTAEVIPLVCTSSYPAKPSDAHLRRIKTLGGIFGTRVGLSDHTLGSAVAVAGIALGAVVIEKHLTLDRGLGGPDSEFSMEPNEFRLMVADGKAAFESLGNPSHFRSDSEFESVRLRPSLWVTQKVTAGDTVTIDNVRSLRPSGGLPPAAWPEVVGKTFKDDFEMGTPLTWACLT